MERWEKRELDDFRIRVFGGFYIRYIENAISRKIVKSRKSENMEGPRSFTTKFAWDLLIIARLIKINYGNVMIELGRKAKWYRVQSLLR